jgi:hypothetical protein
MISNKADTVTANCSVSQKACQSMLMLVCGLFLESAEFAAIIAAA